MKKVNIAIIGTGNIGCDLLIKINRSKILNCNMFIGQNPESEGLKMAQSLGINTSFDSINEIIKNPNCCDIVFDATSADAHKIHAPILKKLNKFTIDMTPSRIGKMCVPIINLKECLKEKNVNMVTCGGQATTPIAKSIMKIHPETKYIEIVSSISSKSAGIGTRNNIDEYTQTTSEALKVLGGAPKSKAIIILNPAEPPILMHNTIFAEINKPNLSKLEKEINNTITEIQKYVPGYKLTLGPVFENNRLTVMIEVIGRGDFLPIYSGNLDIINCAAINVAESYAKKYFDN
jgi:acetaldehyde dehydrogenase